MKVLLRAIERVDRYFGQGERLERFGPIWEAAHSIVFTSGSVTEGSPHVRDRMDLKRVMATVIVALLPCVFMAMYNTGLQANLAIAAGATPLDNWRTATMQAIGLGFAPDRALDCIVHGASYYLPVLIVTMVAGGLWEGVFALVRKHEINEGFLVTGMLFPLILPATIPLWQVALGISFGVVFAKEVFGGTGMNILNPALAARAFLFFAYPAEISGNEVWTAIDSTLPAVDVMTGATPLAAAVDGGLAAVTADATWWDAFLGVVPGSMGETSALGCLVGALVLIVTGVGSWRIMLGVAAGTAATSLGLSAIDLGTNPIVSMPFWWHFVLGGWAFGAAFMATDPVTAAQTDTGRWIYGLLIGVMVVLIRLFNPAYPEGMMLTILFFNVFAPTIDHFVVKANVRRRRRRRVT